MQQDRWDKECQGKQVVALANCKTGRERLSQLQEAEGIKEAACEAYQGCWAAPGLPARP